MVYLNKFFKAFILRFKHKKKKSNNKLYFKVKIDETYVHNLYFSLYIYIYIYI
jgi:hypothetical protein